MREIKFRAWDKKTKRIAEVDAISMDGPIWIWGANGKNMQRELDEIELMQYTGLKDKNGLEIYEGDIVQLSINEEEAHHKGKVEYLAPKFFVMDGEKSGLLLSNKYEVIGNIWENGDLLK